MSDTQLAFPSGTTIKGGGFLAEGAVVYGRDVDVANFVRGRLPHLRHAPWEMYSTLGVIKRGILIGGVVYHDFRAEALDIEITAAFVTRRWASRPVMRHILGYPLNQLGLQRCTAKIAASNCQARAFLEHLGFKLEGVMRQAYDGRIDLEVYGVLRSELNWKP